ncbi:IS481 family transposase [Azohydromonas sediminis]|uniref:IS481 family transposase n=1 Tax=Azohydromonas sediminis TaxID=2259674 RepID=UPI000E64CE83|nr:IS481 family transposase [Azohydromonas sediminis]
MNVHKNASMTPKGRAHLVKEIERLGLAAAAEAAGVSVRTARKWRRRYAAVGEPGLLDGSSRPHRSPARSDATKIERAVALRRTQRLTYERIAERVGLSRSTVARACQAAGLAKLPPLQQRRAGPRYERSSAGELLHLDTKKLGCFRRPGHRVTGDRTQSSANAGWQALHVAIDDHSRVGFSQVLADETSRSACTFLLAALRYFASLGVRVQSVMTDNGSAYTSRRFAKLLHRLGLKHLRTRPYTPRTNGKAERFVQTLLREWAYAYVYPTSQHRTEELPHWIWYYNFHRPHSATGGRPPVTRLGLCGNNVLRNYI